MWHFVGCSDLQTFWFCCWEEGVVESSCVSHTISNSNSDDFFQRATQKCLVGAARDGVFSTEGLHYSSNVLASIFEYEF